MKDWVKLLTVRLWRSCCWV